MANETNTPDGLKPTGFVDRALDIIERLGNKLPDPAALFLLLLFVVWILSALLSSVSFAEIDPRNGKPLVVNNQLTGTAIANFLSTMVTTFTSFHPLGVVLVALLGVGVAESDGKAAAVERRFADEVDVEKSEPTSRRTLRGEMVDLRHLDPIDKIGILAWPASSDEEVGVIAGMGDVRKSRRLRVAITLALRTSSWKPWWKPIRCTARSALRTRGGRRTVRRRIATHTRTPAATAPLPSCITGSLRIFSPYGIDWNQKDMALNRKPIPKSLPICCHRPSKKGIPSRRPSGCWSMRSKAVMPLP